MLQRFHIFCEIKQSLITRLIIWEQQSSLIAGIWCIYQKLSVAHCTDRWI